MIGYTKLRDESWGLRATEALTPGAVVTVSKRDGSQKSETVKALVWSGNGVWLYSVVSTPKMPARPRNWQPCGYPGCSQSYCDECDGEGYRPGR